MKRKALELSDVVRLAYPSLERLDIDQTAANIAERASGKSFLTYASLWPRMPMLVRGTFTQPDIASTFNFYKKEWKNAELQCAMSLLHDEFSGKGTWYKVGMKPIEILPAAYFKPSIKGFWFSEGSSFGVAVNARKRQTWSHAHQRFIARGIYELNCRDDPNDPIPMVVDLSSGGGDNRRFHKATFSNAQMMSADEFEAILRAFFAALARAGVTTVPERVPSFTDMLRKSRGSR